MEVAREDDAAVDVGGGTCVVLEAISPFRD